MSPGIRPSVHGLSPCTQFMEGVIIYTVIKHQISLYRRNYYFFLRDTPGSVQQPYSFSCKGNHTICRNQLQGIFHYRLHIDANGTAPEKMKHKLWSTFMLSHNPISFPQAWRWNFAFYICYKSCFFPLPASLLDISRGINRIKPRQLLMLLVQMLFLSPNILTPC